MREHLVLYSGGKDSFLSVCRIINNGGKATLISFNGGGEACEEHLTHGVKRLINRFGPARIKYVGVYPTVGTLQRLNTNWIYMTQKELGEKWPNITNCQFQCFHCQTAMWIAAIAYAKAKGIDVIASGCKKIDQFCTGIEPYLEAIKKEAESFGIEIVFPVWEIDEGYRRDLEMGENQFIPSVLEPKCLLGRPPINGISEAEKSDMLNYYNEILQPQMKESIERLIPTLKLIKLRNRSFEPYNYDDIPEYAPY